MTREEFDRELRKASGDALTTVTSEQYHAIEQVYTFHPAISEIDGKKQIAMLVKTFGMAIIYDMLPRAEKAEQMENELLQMKQAVANKEQQLRELRTGESEKI